MSCCSILNLHIDVCIFLNCTSRLLFSEIEFFRGLKISGKIFSRRYELSRDSRESILGVFVCKFILLVFSGGDSLLFLFFQFYFICLFFPSFFVKFIHIYIYIYILLFFRFSSWLCLVLLFSRHNKLLNIGAFFAPVYIGTICAQNSGVIYTKWDPLCPSYSGVIFPPEWDHLCPRYLGVIFSPEWDHLCPRCLGAIFHSSESICAGDI